MKKFDVIVIGSGSGGEIVESALSHNLSVAWVDKGPLGGTCPNVGCIPSKMLIYPADRVVEIQEAEKRPELFFEDQRVPCLLFSASSISKMP